MGRRSGRPSAADGLPTSCRFLPTPDRGRLHRNCNHGYKSDGASFQGRQEMQRRNVLRVAALAPATVAAAGIPAAAAADPGDAADGAGHGLGHRHGRAPVVTTEADWAAVATVLGRAGTLSGGTVYRVGFPRRDLTVTSYGVQVKPGLSLGSYAAFARYRDGRAMAMGDLVVIEAELGAVTDALHAHRLDQTAIHKHLLAHDPDVWWTHFHGVGDAVAIARGIRAALDPSFAHGFEQRA